MLTFLRKYQKTLFAVVAVMTTASFLFFGSYGVMQPPTRATDFPIGKTIDGKTVTSQKMQLLIRFLNTSPNEKHLLEKRITPNLLNDGVIQKDFLETGFATMLAEKYFEFLKGDFEKKWEKAKAYRPYAHPTAPFLTAKNLWGHFYPTLSAHYQELLDKKELDVEVFSLLCSLYLDQMQFPPDVMRQILHYQQSQFSWLPPDPALERADLSLFGFSTMEEWLGRRFLSLAAETILQAAADASKKGFKVGLEEARSSLKANLQGGLVKMGQKEFSPQELEELYHRQIGELHWNEEEVVETWQKILLFRKMFQDFGQNLFVDTATLEKTASYASEAISVDFFRLPPELEQVNFRDLLKLQVYLDAVTPSSNRKTKIVSLGLPMVFSSPQEVEKKSPELVEARCEVEIQEVVLSTLSENISLKETCAWEMQEEHWSALKTAFPILQTLSAVTQEDWHEALEKLEIGARAQIDAFAKKSIVQSHPEWLEEAFTRAEKRPATLGLRLQGGNLPFQGAVDREELFERLKNTSVGSTFAYTADQEHHYRITIVSSPKTPEILTFRQVKSDGTLDLLLDRYLAQVYPEIRKKHPALFAQKEGGFKPLKEVQDLVGAEAYAEVLQRIEETSKQHGVTWPDQREKSLDLFAKYRFFEHMQEARSALSNGCAEEGWVQNGASSSDLSKQWSLIRDEKTIKRVEATKQNLEKLFDEKENVLSHVQTQEDEGLYFYRVRQKMHSAGDVEAIATKTRDLLSLDAQRMLFAELLEKMAGRELMADKEGIREEG